VGQRKARRPQGHRPAAGRDRARGLGEFKASYGHYNTDGSNADWNKISVGYGHNLSKRTQVYGTVAFLKNKDGAAKSIGVQGLSAPGTTLGGRSSGFEVGVRHFF